MVTRRPRWWWLTPGLYLKRWVALISVSVALLALGLTYALRHVYAMDAFPSWARYVFLVFLPRPWRALLFTILGLGGLVVGITQLNRTLLRPFIPSGERVFDVLYRYHRPNDDGPRIVVIGGGHGLSTLLRGLKMYTPHITAIVTVADDGGSSGRLRRELGILPPGDFRNCMAALSEAEDLMLRLLQYRFSGGEGLRGHSFGNLLIAAMVGVTGSFEQGLEQSSRVLAVRGRVLPATLQAVTLCAEVAMFRDGELVGWKRVVGESQIPKSGGRIMRVFIEPEVTRAYPEAVRAILHADMVIAGPGSLYTSVLPNLLVREIVEALQATPAMKVYIANVATQKGETDGYTVGDHVQALHEHMGVDLFRWVIYNINYRPSLPAGISWVKPGPKDGELFTLIGGDVVDERKPWRHDPAKLAALVMSLLAHEVVAPELARSETAVGSTSL